MASPQLQQVIDAIKALVSKAGSIEEMRALNEKMARPPEPDVKSEPVLANGVKAEWITRAGRCRRSRRALLTWRRLCNGLLEYPSRSDGPHLARRAGPRAGTGLSPCTRASVSGRGGRRRRWLPVPARTGAASSTHRHSGRFGGRRIDARDTDRGPRRRTRDACGGGVPFAYDRFGVLRASR